jgi:hypothetical protein
MGKINLKDIQSRIASVEYTTKSVNNAMRNIVIPDGYISKNKVNLNDIQHRLAKRKAIDPVPNNLGVDLISFDTELEINLMTSLIRIRYIRANSRGKVYDLTQDNMTAMLRALEELKKENERLSEELRSYVKDERTVQFIQRHKSSIK